MLFCFGLFVAISVEPTGSAAAPRSTVGIGVLSDTPWVLEPLDELIREEIRALLTGEFTVNFPDDAQLSGDGSTTSVKELLDSLLANPNVEMVVAIGPRSTLALAERDSLPKPSFGTTVIERELQGFPLTEKGTSGRPNLAYLVDDLTIGEMLETFGLVARLERVALILDREIAAQIPWISVEVGESSERHLVQLQPVSIEQPLVATLDSLPEDIDGVLIGPMVQFSEDEVRAFANGLAERKLPSFALVSSREVELGLLAAISPSSDVRQIGRRIALMIQDTLLGARPEDLPVAREVKRELTLNLSTAAAIGLPVRFDVMERAVLLHPDANNDAERLTIAQAIERSIVANLDLRSQDRVVAAGREDIWQALALLLPGASASGSIGWAGGNGMTPSTRTKSAGVSAQQVIFDESLLGNLRIARYGQQAVEAVREQVRQDIIQGTGTAYLQVLRAAATLRIQRENLRVTRANLDLARTRKHIGTAAAGEVYRWESEEANALRDLVLTRADDRNSRTSFNRILNRPLEQAFTTVEVEINQISSTLSTPEIRDYFEAPSLMTYVRDFVVQRGLQLAPELAVIDAQVRAQERLLSTRKRSFLSPRIVAAASADRVFEQEVDDVDVGKSRTWSAGLEASIPLLEGGGRVFEMNQAREELAQLRIDRRSTAQQVEERIRIAANNAQASFVAIDFTERAADAGARTLELVTESYSRGAVDVIDLLDAQNNALTSRQLSANAVYDHLIDLFELQRAVGEFELLQSSEERERHLEGFIDFLARRRSRAEPPSVPVELETP